MFYSMHVPYGGFHLGVALWPLYSGKIVWLCVFVCVSSTIHWAHANPQNGSSNS